MPAEPLQRLLGPPDGPGEAWPSDATIDRIARAACAAIDAHLRFYRPKERALAKRLVLEGARQHVEPQLLALVPTPAGLQFATRRGPWSPSAPGPALAIWLALHFDRCPVPAVSRRAAHGQVVRQLEQLARVDLKLANVLAFPPGRHDPGMHLRQCRLSPRLHVLEFIRPPGLRLGPSVARA